MAITKKDLDEQREQIQEDIMCILDGIDDETMDHICQVIVDRFKILTGKFNEL